MMQNFTTTQQKEYYAGSRVDDHDNRVPFLIRSENIHKKLTVNMHSSFSPCLKSELN